jgi:hypothetical protein
MGISQPAPTAPQGNTTVSTQTASATGGAGGSASGGNTGPSQAGGSQGGDAYANGGNAESQNSLEQSNSGRGSGLGSSGGGGNGSDGEYGSVSEGQDNFVVAGTKRRASHRAAARTNRVRTRRDAKSGAAGRDTSRHAHQRGPETGNSSPVGAGQPGKGGQLPSPGPFFSLLSGSGGAGTGLALLLLAVLGAAITLPNHHLNAFRTPAAPWRPPAYVSPIELPG